MSMIAAKQSRDSNALHRAWRYFLKYKWLYFLLIPGLVYLIIFKYIPIYGVTIAFKNFSFKKGIMGSPWNNFEHFKTLFSSPKFWQILGNSLTLSLLKLCINFPIPILLALLLNECKGSAFKRTSQTLMYLPHFISWVVVAGIVKNFFSMDDGMVNELIFGVTNQKINFLGSNEWFRFIIIFTNVWKEAGWGTIIYLSALAAINPDYYEAAKVDGANRFRLLWHITLTGIRNTIVIMLILQIGNVMSNGFEQIYLFQNSLNVDVSEVFETYTYKMGLLQGKFSFSTAVGLFQNVIGMILVIASNRIARALGQASFY